MTRYQSLSHLYMLAWLIAMPFVASTAQAAADARLAKIERSLETNSSVQHLSNESVLDSLQISDSTTVLFDVRTKEEYAVSHLQNAIRLDPDLDPNNFLRNYGSLLEDRQVIFYCSTGRRSTELAEKVAAVQAQQGKVATPANMKGGIFRWHNESKPLVNATAPTEKVHPFNWYWKRLILHKDLTSYAP